MNPFGLVPDPLTLTLSPKGRGDPGARAAVLLTKSSPRRVQPLRRAGCPLPLGERVGVRGDMRQDQGQTARARDLRQHLTEAKKVLWSALRDRRFMGLKFRRQVPVAACVVDFYCARQRLVVEVLDGPQAPRVAGLAALGFRCLHLAPRDIVTNLPGCLMRLADEVSP